jgi:hypothetical protein
MVIIGAALIAPGARAGGPLLVSNGQPTRWARSSIINPANSNLKTVDDQGRVLYRVDTGTLGTLTNEKASRFVDRIFKLYTDIPTATIEFANAGRILDPATGSPIDVNKTNFGRFASSRTPTFQNPIIFDSDGGITGDPRTLGFFGFLQLDQNSNTVREGVVVLNGASISGIGGEIPFLGVFTHEFGHFAGPLDHSQVNGNIAASGRGAILPFGFNRTQTFDLFMPFTETLFPFVFDGSTEKTPGSILGSQGFFSSGFFVASLDLDTQNALSNLYPTDDYRASRGSIEGRVMIKAGSSEIPISGINIIARRISRGAYPPALGTQAFSSQIALDSDGVPNSPPDQDATDPLATAVSAVTGLEFGAGRYRIAGLPPGQYLLELQQINPAAVSGSAIGPLRSGQVSLPITVEYYNGPGNSSNTVTSFTPVGVTAGNISSGIDFTINGLNTTLAAVTEKDSHFKLKKAQVIDFPVEISASAAGSDSSQFKMTFPDGSTDKIEDFYKFTVTSERIFFIVLEPVAGAAGDLDMYLFDADSVAKKKSSLDDLALLNFSAGATADEIIAVRLVPGTYIIGVSAFENSNLAYKLKVISAQ